MSDIYGQEHRRLQQEFDTTRLADRLDVVAVTPEITEQHRAFIESRDMFFLTSIDHRGYPTCSYKGGAPGVLRVIDSKTLAFPSYDGNGMFLSTGNINANDKIGMLLIDFETPHRVRIHGNASIHKEDPLMEEFKGSELVVRVMITEIFANCPRYIHTYQRMHDSKYVPQSDFRKPLTPQWKRINALQDVLPERDREISSQHGVITPEEYMELHMKGEG